MSNLDNYREAIAQVFRSEDDPHSLGTGFLISDGGFVLTCWHVVQSAGVLPEKVYVQFAGYLRLKPAKILHDHADKQLDYVILKVEGRTPTALPFGRWSQQRGSFSSFGFRKNEMANGLAANGILMTSTTLHPNSVPRIQLKSGEIEGGMSGAPVWSDSEQWVVGIISESYFRKDIPQDDDLAFAVPISEILLKEGQAGKDVGLVITLGQKPRNPFTQRVMIADPQYIVGRDQDLAIISGFLNAGQGVLVVGAEQTGKSSLLRKLYDQYKNTPESNNQRLVFIDLNRITSKKSFFSTISFEAAGQVMDADVFDHWVNPQRLLVFLDDYHLLPAARLNNVAIYLRGLGQAHAWRNCPPKVIVATSLLARTQLYPPHEYADKSNPTTIFREHHLQPFGRDEAKELIGVYLKDSKVHFSAQEIASIYQKTAGSPYHLQQEFESLFNAKVSKMN